MSSIHPDLHAIARIALACYGFQAQFPPAVLEEVRAIDPGPTNTRR